jgi:predicted metal-dependent HD superfamily phosphohydrolase
MAKELQAELTADWQRLLTRCGTSPDDIVLNRLLAAYDGPGRYYHNLHHLRAVLQKLHLFSAALPSPALELAAWFHDAVYDPRTTDNEERSAALARQELLRLGLPADLTERVAELVLCTRDHRAPAKDTEAPVLLDADLAILGAAPAAYTTYARAIRQEYAWVPDAEYRAGRCRVLTAFLERPRLFMTEQAWRALEEQARHNLTGELAELGAS